MRKVFFLVCLLVSFHSFGQPLVVFYDSIRAGYLYNIPSPNPTQLWDIAKKSNNITNAVATYVGSAGYGTVTSITPGIGFISHTPITTSGTMNIDTSYTIASIFHLQKGIDSINLKKVGFSDTAAMLANYLAAINNRLTFADTNSIATKKYRQKGIDSVNLTKVGVGDTSSMLTNYMRKYDTTTLSNRINLKVNYTDTSAMLSHYLTAMNNRLTFSDTNVIATKAYRQKSTDSLNLVKLGFSDTASMLTPYMRNYDSSVYSTRKYRQKGIDSLNALVPFLSIANTFTAAQTITKAGGGTTPVAGLTLQNTTAAISGTQQSPPKLVFTGYGFKTSDNSSQSTNWTISSTSAQGSSNPTETLSFIANIAGGADNTPLSMTSSNTVTVNTLSVTNASTLAGALNITAGANKNCGTATLASGTVTVSNTRVTANSLIYVQYKSGTALSLGVGNVSQGFYVSTITASTSFVIVAYTAAGIANATDNSTVEWFFIN